MKILADRSNLPYQYFVSPKNSQTTKASKTSFSFTRDTLRENSSSAIKLLAHSREYSHAKLISKKSAENLTQAFVPQQMQPQDPCSIGVYHQKQQQQLLVDLDDTVNFSPLNQIKYTTTTKAKVQQEATRVHRLNGSKTPCENQNKQRMFKFNVI